MENTLPGNQTASLSMSEDGLVIQIEPSEPQIREEYEALIRHDYERCHPGDSLHFLKLRARFSKEDQGLLRDWMMVAADRARQTRIVG